MPRVGYLSGSNLLHVQCFCSALIFRADDKWNEWYKKQEPEKVFVQYGYSKQGKDIQKTLIRKCYTYPGYSRGADFTSADVGICEVVEPFKLDQAKAWPICVPTEQDKPPAVGESCELTTWGTILEDPNNPKKEKPITDLAGNKVKITKTKPGNRHCKFS